MPLSIFAKSVKDHPWKRCYRLSLQGRRVVLNRRTMVPAQPGHVRFHRDERCNMTLFKNSLSRQAAQPATISMSGISETPLGAPAEYGGSEETLNPEEMLVASVNSCIMLVFYHFAAKFNMDILSYTSQAEGKVEKTRDGLRFTGVTVRAQVGLNSDQPTDEVKRVAQLAEKYCLVSNSLTCPVQYDVEVEQSRDSNQYTGEKRWI